MLSFMAHMIVNLKLPKTLDSHYGLFRHMLVDSSMVILHLLLKYKYKTIEASLSRVTYNNLQGLTTQNTPL